MKLNPLIGILVFCSCFQRTPKIELQNDINPNRYFGSKDGLHIENSPTRGISYNDTLGSSYGLTYITSFITNESDFPTQLEIMLPLEYQYPEAYGDHKFKLILWPELSEPPKLLTDSIGRVLTGFSAHELESSNIFDKTLEPKEKCIVTIGTSFTRLPNLCSAVPYALLSFNNRDRLPDCNWPEDDAPSLNSSVKLGIKAGFCTIGGDYESCSIVPCGQYTYLEY